jgi:hypothetical protein
VFAIPGICALIVFILCRPQEMALVLQKLPLLYIFAAAAVAGLVLDLKLRRLQPIAAPSLPWAAGFLIWALICAGVKIPDKFMPVAIGIVIPFVLYATIAHGVQRFRSYQLVAGVLMASCLFLAFVCFHQGFQQTYCVLEDPVHPGEGHPNDVECETPDVCLTIDAEPGADYRCEKVGMFGTYSVEERVRYRGELQDPNELALTICVGGLSLLIAFIQRKRNAPWILFGGLGVVLVLWTVLLTQSRGGLVVAMAVPGVYFVRRYGFAGLMIGAMAALPLLLLAGGGRDGEAAATSTELRYEAWASGLQMFKQSPIFGVGPRQFAEHHFLTAHNSFVLTLGELGFIGLVLFVSMIFMSIKGVWVGLARLQRVPGAGVARAWGMALLASLLGMCFQINTLSFAYHSVLWVLLGLSGAWVGAVRYHLPEFEVKMTIRDFAIVVVGCAAYAIVILPLFLKWKGFM